MQIDLRTEKMLINRFVDMSKLFDYLGIEYRINGNMFCPFHSNDNTPAAHLYSDDNGYRLWCFSEFKMYGAWDVYKTYLPRVNTRELANIILNKIPEERRESFLSDLGVEEEIDELPFEKSLEDFKHSKITMLQLLHDIASTYTDEA